MRIVIVPSGLQEPSTVPRDGGDTLRSQRKTARAAVAVAAAATAACGPRVGVVAAPSTTVVFG
jgi:hypothetical protein